MLYSENSEIPFTDWSKIIHPNGKVRALGRAKEGKPDGPDTKWHDNGQKAEEGAFKDGKLDGVVTIWNDSGVKIKETYTDGKLERP